MADSIQGTASAASTAVQSTLQATGIGSGLDISSIVTALTNAKGEARTNQLTNRQTTLKAQVSAYGTFRAALDALQATLPDLRNASKLQGRSASVSDEKIAAATASSSATPAQYSVLVTSLASAASLVSQPQLSAASAVGTGTLNITVAGVTAQVAIDSTNNTLDGIAAAINSAPTNPGVNATVINTGGAARLILNGTRTGAVNGITVTQSGGDGGLAALVYDPANGATALTQSQAALDAQFSINGFAASSPSNQVTGVISGVTLNLLQASPANTPFTLTVGYDQDTAQSTIKNFVTAYNALVTALRPLTSYDTATKVAGPLLGNGTVNGVTARLRDVLSSVHLQGAPGAQSLTDLGITKNLDGTLALDASKLSGGLKANLQGITQFFSGQDGFAAQLDAALNPYTQAGGVLDGVTRDLQSGLSQVSAQQQALNLRLATYSATLSKQFNAMDRAIASLKQSQSFITQAFKALDTAQNNSSGS